ncbi:MAG: hypothetical protein IK118_01895 [Clostridia bacterium]|nr:hypothetical protein [Clostridia bacterium]
MKHWKKVLSVILAALMALALAVPAFAGSPETLGLFSGKYAEADALIYEAMLSGETRVDLSDFSFDSQLSGGRSFMDFCIAVRENHPDAFYVNTLSYSYSNGKVTGVTINRNENYSASQISKTNAAVASAVAEADALGLNDLNRVLFAVNFLKERSYCGSSEENKYNTAYDAIMTSNGSAFAHARALAWVLKALGIEAYYTTSESTTCPFDLVILNGKSYFVDMTMTGVTEAMSVLLSEAKMIEKRHDMTSSSKIRACSWKNVKGLCTTTTYDNAWWNIACAGMGYDGGFWYYSDHVNLYKGKMSVPKSGTKLTDRKKERWFAGSSSSCIDVVAAGGNAFFNTPDTIVRYEIATGEQTDFYTLSSTELQKGKIIDLEVNGKKIVYKLSDNYNAFYEAGHITYTGSVAYTCDAHSFSEWTEVDPGTCVRHATEKRTCTVCKAVETRETDRYGDHVCDSWTVTKEATCIEPGTESGVCTLCGAPVTRDTALADHTYVEWVVTKDATCGEDGEEQAVCAVEGCSNVGTRDIPATGNHIDADGDEICDECGADLKKPLTGIKAFFAKLKAFFEKIAEFFRNLFGKKG